MQISDIRDAAARVIAARESLAECLKPNENAWGEWSAKPAEDGSEWHVLGPMHRSRKARTVVGSIILDSFPGENPTRAGRVAKALVTLVNDAVNVVGATIQHLPPDDDSTPIDETWLISVGFVGDKFKCPTLGPLHINIGSKNMSGGMNYQYASVRTYPLPEFPRTRGHVRRLCAALGIHLAEPE